MRYLAETFLATSLLCSVLIFNTSCSNISSQSRNPVASENNVRLGLLYLENGQRQLAESKLLLAMQQDKHNCVAYDAMGYFLEKSGNVKNAEKYYLQGIEFADSGNKGACYNNYGTYLYRQNNYAKALNYFLKAIKEPSYLHVGAAFENAGLAALALHDKSLAKKYFKEALTRDPNLIISKQKLASLSV